MKKAAVLLIFIMFFYNISAMINIGENKDIKNGQYEQNVISVFGQTDINGEAKNVFGIYSKIIVNGKCENIFGIGNDIVISGSVAKKIHNVGGKITNINSLYEKGVDINIGSNKKTQYRIDFNSDKYKGIAANIWKIVVAVLALFSFIVSCIVYYFLENKINRIIEILTGNNRKKIIGYGIIGCFAAMGIAVFLIISIVGLIIFPFYIMFMGIMSIIVSPILYKFIGDLVFGKKINPYLSILSGVLFISIINIFFPVQGLIITYYVKLFLIAVVMITKFGDKELL